MKVCSVDGCGRSGRIVRGWCKKHYTRWQRHGDPTVTRRHEQRKRRPLDERFWEKVERRGPHDCWVWQAHVNAKSGYGTITVEWLPQRRVALAHRLAYELAIGPIPKGLHIDHLCRNRACVNPAHLEAVTQAENNRRSVVVRERNRQGAA